MASSSTIAELATAAGTLVLAVATFASVRSANRTARTAERSLAVGLRPLLFASRLEDPTQTIHWVDGHWVDLPGGHAVAEEEGGQLYLAMSLRNVGSGLAVLHGWALVTDWTAASGHLDPAQFRPQSRDLYVPAGDMSFWQAAIREPSDPGRGAVTEILAAPRSFGIDLLYSDHEGGQRVISRFSITPRGEGTTEWLGAVVRHFQLDRPDPR